MTSRIFNFYISSDEKTSGTNNNANYFIDWSSILPCGMYNCMYTFHTCITNIYIMELTVINYILLYYI